MTIHMRISQTLLLIALVIAVGAIVYKVLTTEVPIDEI